MLVLVLALDSATSVVTVALHDGREVLAERTSVDAARHGEVLAPLIEAVLVEAAATSRDLTEVAVGVGPGPFTGLRVGLVTARVLGLTLRVPVRGVCTLDVLAAAAEVPGPFHVATDARRREVYWASYDDRGRRVAGPGVTSPTEVATDEPVVGRGALLYPASFPNPVGPADPSAGTLAAALLSGRVPALPPDPLYLRRPDAVVPGPPKRVLRAVATEPLPTVLRRMRWWDIEAVLAVEREVFPDDAWSPEQFWAELGRYACGAALPGRR